MADTTKTDRAPRKFESLPDELVGVRAPNGEDAKLTWSFKKAGPLRKKNKNTPDMFALKPVRPSNEEEQQKFIQWMGLKLATELALRNTTQFAVKWTLGPSFHKGSGLFLPEEFQKCVDTFSARGETIKALKEEQEELMEEMVTVNKDKAMTVDNKRKRFEEIANRIEEIQKAIEIKTAEPDEDEDSETVPATS